MPPARCSGLALSMVLGVAFVLFIIMASVCATVYGWVIFLIALVVGSLWRRHQLAAYNKFVEQLISAVKSQVDPLDTQSTIRVTVPPMDGALAVVRAPRWGAGWARS